MTLTEILPSLRRSIPSPLNTRLWPEHTVPTTTDVVIGGIALTRLTEISGTPALLTGDLPHPHARTVRAHGVGMDVTVLVFQITLRVDTQENKRIALTDCSFRDVDARWDECRLIGRASTARGVEIELIPGEDGSSFWPHPVATLPQDLQAGDLLAVPCAGTVTLGTVRPARRDEQYGGPGDEIALEVAL